MKSSATAGVEPKGTTVSTFFTVCANLIGSGLLSLPYTLRRASFAPGVASIALVAFLNLGAVLLLARTSALTGTSSYAALVGEALGARARAGMAAVLALYTLGSCVSYVVLLGDIVPSLLGLGGVTGVFDARTFVLATLGAVVLGPASLLRDLTSLRFNGYGSSSCIAYLTALVLVRALVGPRRDAEVTWAREDGGIFVGLPVTLVAFCMHYNTPKFWAEFGAGVAPEARGRTFALVLAAVFLFALVTYEIVAVAGYLLFGKETVGDVLNNFAPGDPAADVARAALALIQLLSFPIVFNSHRAAVIALLPAWLADSIAAGSARAEAALRDDSRTPPARANLSSDDGSSEALLRSSSGGVGEEGEDVSGGSGWGAAQAAREDGLASQGCGGDGGCGRLLRRPAGYARACAADAPHVVLTFTLVAVVVALGTYFTDLALVLGVKGALGGTVIVYIVPSIAYFSVIRGRAGGADARVDDPQGALLRRFGGSGGGSGSGDGSSDTDDLKGAGFRTVGRGVRSGEATATRIFDDGTSTNDSGLVDPTAPLTPLSWATPSTERGAPLSPTGSESGSAEGGRARVGVWTELVTTPHGLIAVLYTLYGVAVMVLGLLATFGFLG